MKELSLDNSNGIGLTNEKRGWLILYLPRLVNFLSKQTFHSVTNNLGHAW